MARLRRVFIVVVTCASIPALAEFPQTGVAPKPARTAASAKSSAAILPRSPHALERADLEAFFDGIIPLQLERSDIAGATVLVMKDGKDLLRKGYGFSDVSKKKPVEPETTMFRLASISKPFTWISVMQLTEQGKLDIDVNVNKYLDFQIAPAFGKPITLRNLMTHTDMKPLPKMEISRGMLGGGEKVGATREQSPVSLGSILPIHSSVCILAI